MANQFDLIKKGRRVAVTLATGLAPKYQIVYTATITECDEVWFVLAARYHFRRDGPNMSITKAVKNAP
jgi:hypothetical protein